MGKTTYTHCWYNPNTNRLVTNRIMAPEGFECLGHKKVAEAFTTTTKKDWPLLWENRRGGMIRVQNLPSKLKHKLRKVGVTYEGYDWNN